MLITKEGQLCVGDRLRIVGKSTQDTQDVSVKMVITADNNEEIIINRDLNRYFITKLFIKGVSWAKSIELVATGKLSEQQQALLSAFIKSGSNSSKLTDSADRRTINSLIKRKLIAYDKSFNLVATSRALELPITV